MIELLLRLNRQERITLILATHCVDLLPVLATRIYVLRQGRVHREGPPEAVLADAWATAEAGLRLPLIAQLFHELDREGMAAERLPLTVAAGTAADSAMDRPEPPQRRPENRHDAPQRHHHRHLCSGRGQGGGHGPGRRRRRRRRLKSRCPAAKRFAWPSPRPAMRRRPAALAAVRKDAGDDPDATHGLEIVATVAWSAAGGSELRGRRRRGHGHQAGVAGPARTSRPSIPCLGR